MSRIPSIEELAGEVTNLTREVGQRHTCNSPTTHVNFANDTGEVEVSVVTVCFNPLEAGRKEVFLKNLDSVQQQENVRLEHLIIDGGSTDGTLEWLKSYNNTKHDIRILSKSDDGIYEAMNRGIALARGKYIIFLNSDDFFHEPSGMSHSIERIEQFDCDFSFAPIRFSDPSVRHNPQLAPQRRLHRFLISWSFSHQSMLTSRSLLLKLDGFDTSYRSAADFDLLLRMIEAGAKGCFVPLAFSTFTLGGFSYSKENTNLIDEECTRSLQRFYREYYSVEMTYEEVAYIIKHRVYPRKYLKVYKQSQELIRERFIGIPKGLVAWFSRWFNYIKYYLKCLTSST